MKGLATQQPSISILDVKHGSFGDTFPLGKMYCKSNSLKNTQFTMKHFNLTDTAASCFAI